MFDNLSNLALGLVTFAIIIGVGVVVLANFGAGVGGEAQNTTDYLGDQLGETGLAGWAPAIIAVVVGFLFIGLMVGRRGRKI